MSCLVSGMDGSKLISRLLQRIQCRSDAARWRTVDNDTQVAFDGKSDAHYCYAYTAQRASTSPGPWLNSNKLIQFTKKKNLFRLRITPGPTWACMWCFTALCLHSCYESHSLLRCCGYSARYERSCWYICFLHIWQFLWLKWIASKPSKQTHAVETRCFLFDSLHFFLFNMPWLLDSNEN